MKISKKERVFREIYMQNMIFFTYGIPIVLVFAVHLHAQESGLLRDNEQQIVVNNGLNSDSQEYIAEFFFYLDMILHKHQEWQSRDQLYFWQQKKLLWPNNLADLEADLVNNMQAIKQADGKDNTLPILPIWRLPNEILKHILEFVFPVCDKQWCYKLWRDKQLWSKQCIFMTDGLIPEYVQAAPGPYKFQEKNSQKFKRTVMDVVYKNPYVKGYSLMYKEVGGPDNRPLFNGPRKQYYSNAAVTIVFRLIKHLPKACKRKSIAESCKEINELPEEQQNVFFYRTWQYLSKHNSRSFFKASISFCRRDNAH